MDAVIATVGYLFFIFFVIAATVEAILETGRGCLAFLNFNVLVGKYSVDDILQLSKEFAPNPDQIEPRIQALKTAANQLGKKGGDFRGEAEKIEAEILKAVGVKQEIIAAEIARLASSVNAALDHSEFKRVTILRVISAALGCLIVYVGHFYVFELLAAAITSSHSASGIPIQGYETLLIKLKDQQFLNIFVGGVSAAAGSSYWHDQLDKIRSIKNVKQILVNK
jgi:hypothetical protein